MEPKGETKLEGVRMAMGAFDCPICYEPLMPPFYQVMEPKGETKLEGVTMAMGALDCPICYEPLMPLIYQCGVGHLISNSCCIKLYKCPLCPRSAFERCFAMERVVESIEVPCCFAENGCTKKITYFNKKRHEKACRHGSCFCPEPDCSFSGPAGMLPDHFTGHHKWPFTAFEYFVQFDLRLQPGPHVLRAQDGTVFLMNVVVVEPLGHASISLVCVRSPLGSYPFGCSLVYCVVPKASGGAHVVLKTTIDIERRYDIQLGEEDDEDESYDEEDEEEEDDSDDEDKEEDD